MIILQHPVYNGAVACSGFQAILEHYQREIVLLCMLVVKCYCLHRTLQHLYYLQDFGINTGLLGRKALSLGIRLRGKMALEHIF